MKLITIENNRRQQSKKKTKLIAQFQQFRVINFGDELREETLRFIDETEDVRIELNKKEEEDKNGKFEKLL